MNKNKWVSTKERLPEHNDNYLVIHYSTLIGNGTIRDDYVISVLSYRGTVWVDESGHYISKENVKYWQQLPNFPKMLNKKELKINVL